MDNMADAIARPRVPNPEASARALEEKMIVRVQIVDLQKVMIDILNTLCHVSHGRERKRGPSVKVFPISLIERRNSLSLNATAIY
jgi:hypothetical protein